MASNDTSPEFWSWSYFWTHNLWFHLSVFILGSAAFVTNSIICATILSYKALRTENNYIIVLGLAGADAIAGLGSVIHIPVDVFIVQMNNLVWQPVPAWFCAIMPYSLLWKWANFAQTLMLLMVSVDRLVSITCPIYHFGVSTSYSFGLVGFAYGAGFLNICLHLFWPIYAGKMSILACWEPFYQHPLYSKFEMNACAIFSAASVLVYCFVPIMFHRHFKKTQPKSTDQSLARFMKRQKKMAITLGISCFFTLLLDSVPRFMGAFMRYYVDWKLFNWDYAVFTWQLMKVNAVLNFVLFVTRHREVRYAIKSMCKRKTLPGNLENWNVESVVRKESHSNHG